MNLLNIRSDRNPMVVVKPSDTNSPARRALQPVKVNVMQRIRSFLGDSSAPGSASKKVSSAKKERGSSAKKVRRRRGCWNGTSWKEEREGGGAGEDVLR
eukprot:53378-Hanusia_phi.AAC.1